MWLVGFSASSRWGVLWQRKVVFFSGVVAGFLVVENTMTFFPVWVSRFGGCQSLWWCGGCLCLDKFGVG